MIDTYIVRSVRISSTLDEKIRRIAEYEDRTISKTIQRLLQSAVEKYFKDNREYISKDGEKGEQTFFDMLDENDPALLPPSSLYG